MAKRRALNYSNSVCWWRGAPLRTEKQKEPDFSPVMNALSMPAFPASQSA
ncbi:hypothetical protein HYX12_04920, partial [Candidatus Woesearchaeota archaeon]|nr:hypothetical protein [Candidatus Woesearchaeota archaeon]